LGFPGSALTRGPGDDFSFFLHIVTKRHWGQVHISYPLITSFVVKRQSVMAERFPIRIQARCRVSADTCHDASAGVKGRNMSSTEIRRLRQQSFTAMWQRIGVNGSSGRCAARHSYLPCR
jgi:hypothetical protein